jgi:hypothetical protein
LIFNNDLSDPTMSNQARALFGLSIGLSVVTLIMGGVILLLKWALLKKLSEEEDEKAKEMAKRGDSTTMELADVYKGKDEEEGMGGGIERVANPMHSAAMNKLREDNTELRGENARLKERLRQNSPLEDGDNVEEAEETAATMSIPQQDALEADESNDTPSTDQATNRFAGFGEISGKRNALDRKTNPKPRTSRAATEDATVEVCVDEL